jgi:diguanylate cyclase (GGDEF)-like protein
VRRQFERYANPLSRILGVGQLLAAIAAFVIAGGILSAYQFVSLRQTLRDDVEVQGAIVADNIAASLMFHDADAASEVLRSLSHAPYLTSVTVYDEDGEMFARYSVAAGAMGARRQTEEDGLKDVWVVRSIHYRGEQLGSVVLVANTAGIRTGLVRYVALFGLASAVAVLAAWLVLRNTRARMSKAERELDYLAYTDPVTALPNRRASYEALERELRNHAKSGRRLALLIVDLDNFKSVNDTAGHGAGDQLLRRVGNALSGAVRPTDLVGRIGGDEFIIIAPNIHDRTEAFVLASGVIDAFRRPFDVDGVERFATVSIGVSLFSDDAAAMSELLSSADIALYHAKLAGKNRFSGFKAEMTRAARRRVQIERELRKAMDLDGLDVFYQPQLDCHTGQITGFEALVRWPHATEGFIPPDEFIPIAEDSGLIGAIGMWVLRRACTDTLRWNLAHGVSLALAVNVSVRQLRERDFVDQVRQVLHETRLPPVQLELELTESFLMGDVEAALAFMQELRDMGVKLAVDDFGTGYSSLSYLQSFPLNRLKIDRSFVQRLPDSGQTMTRAIISLAHSFELTVVAEGVESPTQLSWLKEAGCDAVQGYLLGRPMPAADVDELLRRTAHAFEATSGA